MPIYEEKLINPLAVRFTQEHIRTTFRDARLVEAAFEEITVEPSSCEDYDLILRAPFPHIEIIRWNTPSRCPSEHAQASVSDTSCAEDDLIRERHWFTLDNRRLYCLQRAAVAHLPKRVAAVVEILYDDAGSGWRKYDSTTKGQSVSIGHSVNMEPIGRWDWRKEAAPAAVASRCTVAELYEAHQVLQVALRDDARHTVDALRDADGLSNATSSDDLAMLAFERLRRFSASNQGSVGAMLPASTKASPVSPPSSVPSGRSTPTLETRSQHRVLERCPTPSTADDSSNSDESESSGSGVELLLGSAWAGRRGETYEVYADDKDTWTCWRYEAHGGSKKFTLTYNAQKSLVWWGLDYAYFCDLSTLGEGSTEIQWYARGDRQKRKPRFVWWWTEN